MKRDTVKFHWGTAFVLVLFHVGALVAIADIVIALFRNEAPFFFSWRMLLLAFAVWTIGCQGVGVGYHRLLTHRSFKTWKIVEYAYTFAGCFSLQGRYIRWVAQHWFHHVNTEQPGVDLHTPLDGFLHSHVGWMIFKKPELQSRELLLKYAHTRRLLKDPVHVVMDKLNWLPISLLGAILLVKIGLAGLIWGVFVPVVMLWNPTWLVNSACHRWGSRMFATRDNSRNNWWVALTTGGEGWHNNHHAHPYSARHGLRWYQFDVNWYVIRAMQFCRLAWKVRVPSV